MLARLNAEINKALAAPDLRERLRATDNVPTGGDARQFTDLIRHEYRMNGQIIREAAFAPSSAVLAMAGARSIPYTLDESEVEFEAVRAQGSGGQNVNKVSNAAHLRFDLRRATLIEARQCLPTHADRRIGADGVVRIKAQEHRSLERNRRAAPERLRALLDAAAVLRAAPRHPTDTGRAAAPRVEGKLYRGIKAGRGRVTE